MEPKSWKWIQGIVILAAAALGIGLAVWYEGRPPDTALPAEASVPKRKMIVHHSHADVFPSVAPRPAASGTVASASPDGFDASVPVPSQSSVNSWQKQAVDPSVHLSPPTADGGLTPSGAGPTSPVAPPAYLPPSTVANPASAPLSPGPVPTAPAFGGPGPTGGSAGTPTTGAIPGPAPFVPGPGAGAAPPGGPGGPAGGGAPPGI